MLPGISTEAGHVAVNQPFCPWLWHGPLSLACVILITSLVGRTFPGLKHFRNALPLVALLAVWTVFSLGRRRRQANELQREIDELNRSVQGGESE